MHYAVSDQYPIKQYLIVDRRHVIGLTRLSSDRHFPCVPLWGMVYDYTERKLYTALDPLLRDLNDPPLSSGRRLHGS